MLQAAASTNGNIYILSHQKRRSHRRCPAHVLTGALYTSLVCFDLIMQWTHRVPHANTL